MENHRILFALYDDTINKPAIAEEVEAYLIKNPSDIYSRAHLIHYYFNREIRNALGEITEGRLRHIEWFIKTYPDLEFCGSSPFYLKLSDPNFGYIKSLWQKAISDSQAEMRRVNACMYIAYGDRVEAAKLSKEIFTHDSENIWIKALRDYLFDTTNCFQTALSLERTNPMVVDDSIKAIVRAELKEKNWETSTLSDWQEIYSETCRFPTNSFFCKSLKEASELAASSLFGFESNSILGFNPEAILVRFKLACWMIRHLPSYKITRSPIFMGPFESPRSYLIFDLDNFANLECLFDYLAELWIAQLNTIPRKRATASNAARFAIQWEKFFPAASGLLVSELKKTDIGKTALNKERKR